MLAIEIRVSYYVTDAELVNCADALPNMDSAQEHYERRVGDQLIEWYNQRHRTSFRFDGRTDEAPDLKYRDGKHWLRVEVTSAYYDPKDDAKFKWGAERQLPDAPREWEGKDFEEFLVARINSVIVAKCRNDYGPHCLLAVYVLGDMTFADEMEALLKSVSVPATPQFDGIYLCGEFAVPIGLYASRLFESGTHRQSDGYGNFGPVK